MENDKIVGLEELEVERQSVKKKSATLKTVGGILVLVFVLVFVFLRSPVGMILGFMGSVVAFYLLFMGSSIKSNFAKKFKSQVLTKLIVSELGPDAIYEANGGISIEEINALHAFQRPDRYRQEDFISHIYNGVPYELCDTVLEEKVVTTDGRGNTHVSYHPYFRGRMVKIDYRKNLNIDLTIVKTPLAGFRPGELTKFQTELIEFNETFQCYAKNAEEGFYILTPSFLNKLLEFEKYYRGSLYFIFKYNCLYILINDNRDSLELNVDHPIDESQLQRLKSDLFLPSAIINELHLDSKKFNKTEETLS